MRWIYISPHLDDAVLSLGGLIYDQAHTGQEVEIWTMFCGLPITDEVSLFARELHLQWGFRSAEETVLSRREEDSRAVATLGARGVHFDFPDCIYRRGMDGNWLYPDNTFVSPHKDEVEFIEKMTTALAERLESDDTLICPLAIGGHVDHVIVRRAVENLNHSLMYYADFPYLLDAPSSFDTIEKTMQATNKMVSRIGLAAWQESAAAYKSQIPMEFENRRKMQKAISGYGRKGVRLWSLS
ncbi:MAG: PIG-L family deacetylase [Anaerolineales bacterium]|nr:PIG-L family deacetylase [Anaerolineales bacterium]